MDKRLHRIEHEQSRAVPLRLLSNMQNDTNPLRTLRDATGGDFDHKSLEDYVVYYCTPNGRKYLAEYGYTSDVKKARLLSYDAALGVQRDWLRLSKMHRFHHLRSAAIAPHIKHN